MRLLVCGGRRFNDRGLVYSVLNSVHGHTPISTIITGAASGADQLAEEWADWNRVPVMLFSADWSLGPRAGPIRNARMLEEGRPDGVLAFPGGAGTADMVRRAVAAGVPVNEVGGDRPR